MVTTCFGMNTGSKTLTATSVDEFVGYVEVQNHNSTVGGSLYMFGSMMLSSGVLDFAQAGISCV